MCITGVSRHVMFIIRSPFWTREVEFCSRVSLAPSPSFSKWRKTMRRLREVYFHGREINLWRIKNTEINILRETTRDQSLKISSRILHESPQNLLEIFKNLQESSRIDLLESEDRDNYWKTAWRQKWTRQQRLRSFWVLVRVQKVPKVMIQIKFYKKGKGMTTQFL